MSDEQTGADELGDRSIPFVRFTADARAAVVKAQEEARELRHNFIGTEHLLLGVLAVADGQVAELLSLHGVRTDSVRPQVKQLVESSPGPAVGAPPFTPRALRSLQLAGEQADALHRERVDVGHLLLGLLAEGRGLAAQFLGSAGVGLSEARRVAPSS